MSPGPLPRPDPETLQAIAMAALVHELARGYLDRDNRAVSAVDERIRTFTFTPPGLATAGPDRGDHGDMAAYLAVTGAEQMFQEWLAREAEVPMPEVLAGARHLVVNFAPSALRVALRDTFDQIIAGRAKLFVLGHDGLPVYADAHLYAAATASVIGLMHPMIHNHARLALEERIRNAQTVSQGMPAAEAAGYVPEHEAAALLTELLPWTEEMTGAAHETTKRDLRALVRLYLLDHPFPTAQQKADLRARIGRRIHELTTLVGNERGRSRAEPEPGLSRQQLAARRRAERARRQRRRKPDR